MSKRTKISLIVGSVSLFLVIGGFAIYAMITGMFKIDYSATYITAKELRGTMQKLRSDASCEKVIEYLNSQYTNMELYNGYVEKCRKIGEGVTLDMVTAVGDTAGVLRDEEVRKRYETFYRVIVAARDGNVKVDKLLDTYVLWHSWIVKENSGNSIHNDWDWSEADIDNATKILTDSKIDEFQKYGTEWAKYKKEAAKATHTFMHSAMISDLNEAKNEMEAKQKAFNEWKIKNLPVVTH